MKTMTAPLVLFLCWLTAAFAGDSAFRPPRRAAPSDEVLLQAGAMERAGRVADAEAVLRAGYREEQAAVTKFRIAERLASMALEDGRLDDCARWLDEACRHGLPVRSWHITRARLEFRQGKEAACLERLDGLHRQTPQTALYRGIAAMRLGRWETALAALREAGSGESLNSPRRLVLLSARRILTRNDREREHAWRPAYRALLTGEDADEIGDAVLAEMVAYIAAEPAKPADDPLIALSSPLP